MGWEGLYGRPSSLQFTGGSATSAYGRRIVCGGDCDDIPDAHLYLQIAITRLMVMCKEHEHMMSNDISLICVARKDHLAPRCIFCRGNGYLFTIFSHYKFTCFWPYEVIWPEHEGNDPPLKPLLPQAISEVVGELANGSEGFVSVCGVVKTYTRILTERWSVRNDETGVLTVCYLVEPA